MKKISRAPRVAFYVRVSKDEQTIENQMIELNSLAVLEGWDLASVTIFTDEGITGSVGREKRPGFDDLLNQTSRGYFDIVAAWSLDRLGREPKDVFELTAMATRKGFTIYLHKDRIDTGTAAGELFFTIMAGMAKFERRRLQERILCGLERARAQGKRLGRPTLDDETFVSNVLRLSSEGNSRRQIARLLKCSHNTVSKTLELNKPD
jgi:DNA invertase Pin-like site-specific DNA recombinase